MDVVFHQETVRLQTDGGFKNIEDLTREELIEIIKSMASSIYRISGEKQAIINTMNKFLAKDSAALESAIQEENRGY